MKIVLFKRHYIQNKNYFNNTKGINGGKFQNLSEVNISVKGAIFGANCIHDACIFPPFLKTYNDVLFLWENFLCGIKLSLK